MADESRMTNATDQAALAKLRAEMARPPFHQVLSPQAVHADPATGVVVIRLPYQSHLSRAPDEASYHGGVIAALIDLAGHAAVAVSIGRMAPTIDLRIDYLRPADNSDLTATATLIKAGRSVARADIEIKDAQGRLIAIGRGSFSTVAP
jgi:uncharacterized protein (TIGR00369 family)